MPNPIAEKLCLACGLCCNGVLFADVRLQPGDSAARLRALGLPLKKSAIRNSQPAIQKFPQPCVAHDGCHCKIYPDRPAYCRQFDCALLKNVAAKKVEPEMALCLIRSAKKRAERVRQLLRQLGDKDETCSLSQRFRRTRARIEGGWIEEETADLFGQLTLAVHDLNFCLSEKFYPGRES